MLDPRDDDMLLEAYLDDELSIEEKQALELRLADDQELAGQLALARRVQIGLRTLPSQTCPPETVQQVLTEIERQELGWAGRIRHWRQALTELLTPSPNPAWLGMALGLALTVALIRPWDGLSTPSISTTDATSIASVKPRPTVGQVDSIGQPTAQEVAAAEEEVKLALAYLGKLGRTAGSSVRKITSDHLTTESGGRP